VVEIQLQLVELLFPELPVVIEPGHGIAHRRGDQPAAPAASVATAHHQPGPLEDPEVLAYRGQGHPERRRQLADRALLVPQSPQQPAASRVGQGAEDGIEGPSWVYHVV
jgi:hypothetical protein